MLPAATVTTILQAVEREGRDPAITEDVDPAIVTGIERALANLGEASMLELACNCWGASRSEPLRAVLLAYVNQWARGNEARLGAVLETAPSDVGMLLVGLLSGLGTPQAIMALEAARKNPYIAVRIEALTKVSSDREDEVRVEVRKMLDDPSSVARQDALALVAERGLMAAGPAIVLQIQNPTFHTLTVDERQLWLHSLLTLNPRRAASVCSELLKEHQIIPTEAVEATRVLCAELLSGMASEEALDAALEASKKRWWNSTPVREAAERAVTRINANIASGAGEPAQTSRRKKPDLP